MVYDAIIIGSGLSGLSCAQELFKTVPNILVLDKGYLPGGRTASKTIKTDIGSAVVDYGAQYFTVDQIEFQFQVNNWIKSNTVKKWAFRFESMVSEEHRESKMRYMGFPTMRSVCIEMAESLPVRQQMKVIRIEETAHKNWIVKCESGDEFETKAIINTAPLEQSLELCYRSGIIPADKTVTFFSQQKYHHCAAILIVTDTDSLIPEPGGLWFPDQSAVRWIADNKKKGISPITSITIHLSPEASKAAYSITKEEIIDSLDEEVKALLPGNWIHTSVHKWKFAQPVNIVDMAYLQDSYYKNLWFCGDVFLNGRVESAWMSGYKTAKAFSEQVEQ